ncbi:hypothetical protein STCU_00065 [Strigomonas culicis]|uniref:CNNM transmembrane domain-containing protein n=1 Tax=Strigomonas culicis TaxID=28005 RepID=S9V2A5_9TRYP|nr:hypothetical protein STCU_03574 [Strigomonas culicis]EPY37232.1 hypothetical protein STCU_00065 [Strigomonas culicis]|eukprot:EPY31198.1 hypothetical protein STCU_03574 [Strigomonas culicis]
MVSLSRNCRKYIFLAFFILYFAFLAAAVQRQNSNEGLSERQLQNERRRHTKRVYALLDNMFRICVFMFLSAVFAGLTLGVMCANVFTLEIIAESGPVPDCKYAETLLPLRKQGHKTLCTLIVSNMLLNVLIAEEFTEVFTIFYAIVGESTDPSEMPSERTIAIYSFLASTISILVFAELIPMSICRSKYSLKVAAAGSMFVYVAMFLTYPVSVPLGKLLDWVVGNEETGQTYDRRELRKLMALHVEHEDKSGNNLAKSELDLLLAAMDFHERTVKDIMTPIARVTFVHEDDLITPDFVERLWLSGRSRVPVVAANGQFSDILVVKDLMSVSLLHEFEAVTVANVVSETNRLFAMVNGNTNLPSMLKFFQDAKTHMAVVFADESADAVGSPNHEGHLDATTRRSVNFRRPQQADVIGIVTMEDVVEELLNDEIYDEYDRYDPADTKTPSIKTKVDNRTDVVLPLEPQKQPRVNFYSYFTHPEADVPLTEGQVWAVAYFLNRTVKCFMGWSPPYIKLLLDEIKDEQLVALEPTKSNEHTPVTAVASELPNANASCSTNNTSVPVAHLRGDHTQFLSRVAEERFVLYAKGVSADHFTLVLGGRVDMLVGNDNFSSKLLSFDSIGEEALTSNFYVPEFSAAVLSSARVYRIPKATFEKCLSYQSIRENRKSHIRVLGGKSSQKAQSRTRSRGAEIGDPLEFSTQKCTLPSGLSSGSNKAYGTFN